MFLWSSGFFTLFPFSSLIPRPSIPKILHLLRLCFYLFSLLKKKKSLRGDYLSTPTSTALNSPVPPCSSYRYHALLQHTSLALQTHCWKLICGSLLCASFKSTKTTWPPLNFTVPKAHLLWKEIANAVYFCCVHVSLCLFRWLFF